MMATNPWDLMRELSSMHERMNRLWGGVHDRSHEDVTNRGGWQPPVDICEAEGQVVLKADLPGLNRQDIELSVEQNTLTIKGHRRPDDQVREEQYHRIERAYGPFSRSFTLPNTIDSGGVRADYRNGVLTVTLPVRQDARPRQIQVEAND
jgi:HSP20 family protein